MGVYIILIGIIIVLFSLFVWAFNNKDSASNKSTAKDIYYELFNGDKLYIQSSDNLTIQKEDRVDYPYEVYDLITIYEVEDNGELTITERVFPNQDSFVFTKWDNIQKNDEKITFTLKYDESNNYEVNGFAKYDIEHEHDNALGVDPTTYPNGLIRINHFQDHKRDIMLGKNYLSELLTMDYEDDDKFSYIRKLHNEYEDYQIFKDADQVTVSFHLNGQADKISEQWFMISDEPLFEGDEELQEWIKISNEQYKKVNAWYTADGTYSKLPWSIEPAEKMGYGRNILFFREDHAAERFKDHAEERYYHNLLLNSLINYENYQTNEDGLFLTHYTSTWLKKLYGTRAPYVDTRHNELGLIYFNETLELLGFEPKKELVITYADFLVKQEELDNVIPVPNSEGYFISDYYDPSEKAKKTHTSLNHVLGEMNFLLQVYIDTQDEKYFEVAQKILNAVKATEDDWIREDSDLWYQVSTEFEYSGRDYELRTLIDLIDAEILLNQIDPNTGHIFEKLILSKIEYLNSIEFELGPIVEEKLVEANYTNM